MNSKALEVNSSYDEDPKRNPSNGRFWRLLVTLTSIFNVVIITSIIVHFSGGSIGNNQDKEKEIGLTGLKIPSQEKLRRIVQDQQPIEKNNKSLRSLFPLTDSTAQLYFPPAGNQGKQSSCTAFSVAYGLVSYYEKRRTGYSYATDLRGNPSGTKVFSPAFVYNELCHGDCDEGIEFIDAFDFISLNGVCHWNKAMYEATKETGCQTKITSEAYSNAKEFLGYNFYTPKRTFNRFLEYLDAGIPLIIGIYTSETMYDDGRDKNRKKPFYWNPDEDDLYEYHAMLCVGYDKEKSSFILLNSWGKRWGDDGYCFIKKDVFMARFREAYIARLERSENLSQNFPFIRDTAFMEITVTKRILQYDSVSAKASNDSLKTLFRRDYERLERLKNRTAKQDSLMQQIKLYILS
jgi:C1A family cysteine protease